MSTNPPQLQPETAAEDEAAKMRYVYCLFIEAEELIAVGFTAMIAQLNDLLRSPMFNQKIFDAVHKDMNMLIKGNHVPDVLPPHDWMYKMIAVVRPMALKMAEDTLLLKAWLFVLTQNTSLEDTASVELQYDIRKLVCWAAALAEFQLDKLDEYISERSEILQDNMKNSRKPRLCRCVRDFDIRVYHALTEMVGEMQDNYNILNDFIRKNMQHLQNPSSSARLSTYSPPLPQT